MKQTKLNTGVKSKDTFKTTEDILSHYTEIDEMTRNLKMHLFNVNRKDMDKETRKAYAREIEIIMIILNVKAKTMIKLIKNQKEK